MDVMLGGGAPSAGGGKGSEFIKDSDSRSFMADVIEASMEVPVIVDFWAPWCGPCKQLGPILEKAVTAAKGAVKLVKVDIDQSPEISQQMRIQSIPAVYAFYQGRPLDGFQGAMPESQVKAFIEKLIKASGGQPADDGLDDAIAEGWKRLETGDLTAAASIFEQVISHAPDRADGYAGYAKYLMAVEQEEAAKELLTSAPEDLADDPLIIGVLRELELAEETADVGDLTELTQAVEANPDDLDKRFEYAIALYGSKKPEEAADQLLEIIRRDREWNEDAARKKLVEFFEAWGMTDKRTLAYRRKLSSILFS